MKDIAVAATNDNDSLAAASLQSKTAVTASVADDRPSVKNSYHSMRSLKQKNDRACNYGTGSSDLHRASSLQDVTDGSGVKRSYHPVTDNMVSYIQVGCDIASDVGHLHGMSSADACSTNAACTQYDRSSSTYAERQVLSPRRSRCRTRRPCTNLELELVGNTGVVSNTAQFWEDLVVDSRSSAAFSGIRPRHLSEDRRRFMRRDLSFPRYSTIGAPCDIQTLHGMTCVPQTTSHVLSGSESLHANSELEVCFWLWIYSLHSFHRMPLCMFISY